MFRIFYIYLLLLVLVCRACSLLGDCGVYILFSFLSIEQTDDEAYFSINLYLFLFHFIIVYSGWGYFKRIKNVHYCRVLDFMRDTNLIGISLTFNDSFSFFSISQCFSVIMSLEVLNYIHYKITILFFESKKKKWKKARKLSPMAFYFVAFTT